VWRQGRANMLHLSSQNATLIGVLAWQKLDGLAYYTTSPRMFLRLHALTHWQLQWRFQNKLEDDST